MGLTEAKSLIEKQLMLSYDYVVENGKIIFENDINGRFSIDCLRWNATDDEDKDNSVVISYYKTGDDSKQFYPSDYNYDIEKIVEDMVKDIEEPLDNE